MYHLIFAKPIWSLINFQLQNWLNYLLDISCHLLNKWKRKVFCKIHNSWRHSTNNCIIFRDVIHDLIKQGKLKFLDKPKSTMKVDNDSFPAATVNMVDIRFSLNSYEKYLSVAEEMLIGTIRLFHQRWPLLRLPWYCTLQQVLHRASHW